MRLERQDLLERGFEGPWLARCGVAEPTGWHRRWCARLPAEIPLDPVLLHGFALPLLERLQQLAAAGGRPVLALNAPVGAGKTTLCRLLAQLAPLLGVRLAVASIDDLYLPWAQRQQAMAGNPFGVTRVPPGSHDPALLCERLEHWRAGGALRLPRFDKTLRDGEGDRCADRIEPAANALLLEGWLLGCQPLGPALAPHLLQHTGGPCGHLHEEERCWLPHWDRALEAYLPLWQHCQELWLMHPLHWRLPRRWRFQAEARQRRKGGNTLGAAALEGLVRASLCSLPPQLYQQPLLEGLERPLSMGEGVSAASTRSQPVAVKPFTAAVIDQRRRLHHLLVAEPAPLPG
jgi:D-glycerate 3-kinase